jgi:hypothetical protein
MEKKICKTCQIEKDISFFVIGLNKNGKRYYRNKCKECKNLKCRESYIPRPSDRINWTDELIKEESLKYNHKIDFIKNSPSAYNASRYKKILDDVCSHMLPLGDIYRRVVYVYEFDDKRVYVGLTCNKERRHLQHMKDGRSPVFKHIEETKLQPKFKILTDSYISQRDSQLMEKQTLENYINNGWIPLNSHTTGGLGGTNLKWTEESLRLEALKYKTRKEMSEKSSQAYSAIRKKKLYHLFSHMDWILNPNHNLEECIEYAKKYDKLSDFKKKHNNLYHWINRRKLNDVVFSHMEKRKKWTLDEALLISKKYKTIKDFMKNDLNAYRYLVSRKDFYELTKHLNRHR